ncbi:MAG: RNA methyltransferase [Verrucomicrobia bacterium]|nr:RNA methyltransferase [Verrucomicrobiota bacterium]
MLAVQSITSFDLPELQPYRTMQYQFEHRQQGIFVAEGEKVVRRLIESSLPVVSVMLPAKWLADYQRLLGPRAASEDIRVFVGEKKLLEQLSGFSMYQGVLAVGKVPPPPDLDRLLREGPRPLLFVATEAMSNALNMGALVRNCAALGAQALLVSETCCSPFIRRAVRASMGTIFRLPALELPSLAEGLRVLRSRGLRLIAAHPHTDRRTLAQADFTGDCCVVLGSEGQGITPAVLALCDDLVAIPMPPDVDSLNVASASAVFLYEVARQRGGLAPVRQAQTS